jgi:hypothetical protein
MPPNVWARVKRAGAHALRRGAWYRVANDANPKLLLLDVNKRMVPVPREMLELSESPPERWSVVKWQGSERGAQRASDAESGLFYVVCPRCRARAGIEPPDTQRLSCPVCGGEFAVDWENTC